VVKQTAGGLAVLLIIFGVLRPLLRDLTGVREREKRDDDISDEDEEEAAQLAAAGIQGSLEDTLEALDMQEQLEELEKEDADLVERLRAQIDADPRIAAKVLREMMNE
jgi:flagellar M-ring protein FliF